MRFLADENVPAASVAVLRDGGHDVVVVGERHTGLPDEAIVALARAEDRVLVTFDRDFGELLFRRGVAPPPGLVYLRFEAATPEEAGQILVMLAARHDIPVTGRMTVVDRHSVRQRRLPRSL